MCVCVSLAAIDEFVHLFHYLFLLFFTHFFPIPFIALSFSLRAHSGGLSISHTHTHRHAQTDVHMHYIRQEGRQTQTTSAVWGHFLFNVIYKQLLSLALFDNHIQNICVAQMKRGGEKNREIGGRGEGREGEKVEREREEGRGGGGGRDEEVDRTEERGEGAVQCLSWMSQQNKKTQLKKKGI